MLLVDDQSLLSAGCRRCYQPTTPSPPHVDLFGRTANFGDNHREPGGAGWWFEQQREILRKRGSDGGGPPPCDGVAVEPGETEQKRRGAVFRRRSAVCGGAASAVVVLLFRQATQFSRGDLRQLGSIVGQTWSKAVNETTWADGHTCSGQIQSLFRSSFDGQPSQLSKATQPVNSVDSVNSVNKNHTKTRNIVECTLASLILETTSQSRN
uniref:Uncharacterized protein n=1 Tax=Helianthus annuus TaxID=4232 RepID=A0A251RNG7_HELAN